jgi:hypothetical protein
MRSEYMTNTTDTTLDKAEQPKRLYIPLDRILEDYRDHVLEASSAIRQWVKAEIIYNMTMGKTYFAGYRSIAKIFGVSKSTAINAISRLDFITKTYKTVTMPDGKVCEVWAFGFTDAYLEKHPITPVEPLLADKGHFTDAAETETDQEPTPALDAPTIAKQIGGAYYRRAKDAYSKLGITDLTKRTDTKDRNDMAASRLADLVASGKTTIKTVEAYLTRYLDERLGKVQTCDIGGLTVSLTLVQEWIARDLRDLDKVRAVA